MTRSLLIEELQNDEGVRLYVYDDADGMLLRPGKTLIGHPTLGCGRALDTNGITAEEARYLLDNDIDRLEIELAKALTWFTGLDDVRQRVLVNMAFNMGVAGLMQFHDTLRYIEEQRWELASRAMLDSRWAGQVGKRAVRLAEMMRTGAV